MLRAVWVIFAILCGLIIINWVFWHLLGLVAILLGLAFWLAVVLVIGYFIYSALQPSLKSNKGNDVIAYKLWDTHGHRVQVFRSRPTIQDLVTSASAAGSSGESKNTFSIANDTRVSILEDTGGEAIKIRILDESAKEKLGWVSRSVLVRESNLG